MKNVKVGDMVIVAKNNMGTEWDFLVGEVGTVIGLFGEPVEAIIQFDQDQQWAEHEYRCGLDEIEFFSENEILFYPNENDHAISSKDVFNVFSWRENGVLNKVWIDVFGNIMQTDIVGYGKPYKVSLDHVCNLCCETESSILSKWREFYKSLDR